jgi:hypothetical protein
MSNRHIYAANDCDVNPVKVCIYKHADPVKIIPLAVLWVDRGEQAKWTPPPADVGNVFTFRFFRSALLDEFLAGVDGVTWGQTVTIRGDARSGYTVTVSGAELAEAV